MASAAGLRPLVCHLVAGLLLLASSSGVGGTVILQVGRCWRYRSPPRFFCARLLPTLQPVGQLVICCYIPGCREGCTIGRFGRPVSTELHPSPPNLQANNYTFDPLQDMAADFGPRIPPEGVEGLLVVRAPLVGGGQELGLIVRQPGAHSHLLLTPLSFQSTLLCRWPSLRTRASR